jgi:hypothetical protein
MPSYEEMRKIFDKINKECEEREAKREHEWQEEIIKRKANGERFIETGPAPKLRCDHPNTMEDGTATVFWVIAMVVSLLFKGGWVLCIVETVVWWKFISRYK